MPARRYKNRRFRVTKDFNNNGDIMIETLPENDMQHLHIESQPPYRESHTYYHYTPQRHIYNYGRKRQKNDVYYHWDEPKKMPINDYQAWQIARGNRQDTFENNKFWLDKIIKYAPDLLQYGYGKKRQSVLYAMEKGRRMKYNPRTYVGRYNKWRYDTNVRMRKRIPFFRGRIFKYYAASPYDRGYSPFDRDVQYEYRRYQSYKPKKGFFDIFR